MSTGNPDSKGIGASGLRLTWPKPAGTEGPEVTPTPREAAPPASPTARWDRTAAIEVNADAGVGGSGALRRTMVESYDRLADRLLQRLRAVHEDVDADLTEVRSQLGELREAVNDLGGHAQLRQLRVALDALRGDVADLRRDVLDAPELAQVASDVAALRADMTDLVGGFGAITGQSPSGREAVRSPLVDEITALRDDFAQLRAEVTILRRRMVLRAGGS